MESHKTLCYLEMLYYVLRLSNGESRKSFKAPLHISLLVLDEAHEKVTTKPTIKCLPDHFPPNIFPISFF